MEAHNSVMLVMLAVVFAPQALMSLFVLSSKDGWVNIMYDGLDAVAVDVQVCVCILQITAQCECDCPKTPVVFTVFLFPESLR